MVKVVSRRAFTNIGVTLSIAFASLLTACTGKEVPFLGSDEPFTFELDEPFTFELDELEYMNELTREELNERLRELAEKQNELEFVESAMCYAPYEGEIAYTPLPCSTCSAKAQMTDWQIESLERIQAIVNEMISEGFDVKLDVTISCKKCADEYSARFLTSFGIRFTDDTDYHMVETSYAEDYEILLAFLRGEEFYADTVGLSFPLHQRQGVIKKMTGLTV